MSEPTNKELQEEFDAAGFPKVSQANFFKARDVLMVDIGKYGGNDRPYYQFDTDTMRQLVAYARQDAHHAMLNTISILKELEAIKRDIRWITSLVGFLVVMVGCLFWIAMFGRPGAA